MSPPDLPRWDTTWLFPGLDSRDFAAAGEALAARLDRLVAAYDRAGVGATPPAPPSAADLAALEHDLLPATNDALADVQRLRAYVRAHVTTDSRDGRAQAALSALQRHEATARKLGSRLAAWVAARGVDALTGAGPVSADHAWPLERAAQRAIHQMSEAEELLLADLAVTGSLAWGGLHGDLTSQLTATVDGPDGAVTLPMAAVRGLATDPDPGVRRAAFEAEQRAWPTVAVPLAAAMNAIKGEAITVNDRRGWSDPLDASLFANAVDRATFEAMDTAVTESLPDFHRWLRVKARLHGHDGPLPWWDLVAPLPAAPARVTWDDGRAVVARAFSAYAPALGRLVDRATGEAWIDAEPRTGKRGGAFCMPAEGDRSFVFLNWSDSFDSVQTLAHELGHAWHNVQLADRTPLQRQLTMALAETASIFCETLVVEAGLASAPGPERLALLDTDLQGTTQVVVDIRSRLLFEREVFRRRRRQTLDAGELCELMTEAQGQAYGDAVDPSTRHPWMWAVKPHYYGSHFYNWPYTFGLLFGLGIHARYLDDPERFRADYDGALADVGLADARTIASRFAIDTADPDFWRSALDRCRARIGDYEATAAALGSLTDPG